MLPLESIPPEMRPYIVPAMHYAVASILSGTVHDAFKNVIELLSESIPLKNRSIPKHNIFIPALEGYALNPDQPILQEMFYNLLVNSMDKTKQDLCHPAFPNILSQLSIDEIIVLYQYDKNNIKENMGSPTTLSFAVDTKSTIKSYLVQLGLLALFDCSQVANGAYGYILQCSSYGKQFIKACINEKTEELINEIIKNNPK